MGVTERQSGQTHPYSLPGRRRSGWMVCWGLILAGGNAWVAADVEPHEPHPENPHVFCDLYKDFFDRFTVYKSDSGFLRSFAFIGRYQGEFFHNSQHLGATTVPPGNVDDNDTDWFVRRFRFGFKAEFLNQVSLLADWNLDPTWKEGENRFAGIGLCDSGFDGRRKGEVGFFQNLFQVQLAWKMNERVNFVAGKFEPDVTMEDAMPTAKLFTLENSSITEMLNHESTAGAKVELVDVLGSDVVLGVFNSGAEDDHRTNAGGRLPAQVSDLPQTNGDWGFQVKLNRDLWSVPKDEPAQTLKKLRGGLWWFHAEDTRDPGTVGLDTNFEEFTDIWSFNTELEADRCGLFTDFLIGNVDPVKDNDTDVRGLVLMPYVDLSEKWQLVYRYTRVWGDYGEEDRLAGRGVGVDLDGRLRTGGGMVEGDTLSTHYAGVNYYLCGHKLKLQFGVEHLNLEDPRSLAPIRDAEYWSYQSAVKMYF